LMGFVNFRLFTSMNLCYPPKSAVPISQGDAKLLAGEDDADIENEYIAALGRPLLKSRIDENDADVKTDEFESNLEEGEEELKSCVGLTFAETNKLQKLFEGLKFFISREVPREALVFVLRSFGGQVSWDKVTFIGATFDESDEKITHHIVDREVIPNKFMNRHYIQPQWVFDCINARVLLPVQDYFPGEILPPHLSPFVQEAEGDYVAPEVDKLRNLRAGVKPADRAQDINEDESEDEQEKEDKKEQEANKAAKRSKGKTNFEDAKRQKVDAVHPGKLVREDISKTKKNEAAEEKRLAEMMIPKKKKHLYDKIMFGKKRKAKEVANLQEKRAQHDKANKRDKRKSR